MNSVRIVGGKSLKGEVIPQGAKNEALQVLCAVLLTDDKVTINNIPDIIDVNKLIDDETYKLIDYLFVETHEKKNSELTKKHKFT